MCRRVIGVQLMVVCLFFSALNPLGAGGHRPSSDTMVVNVDNMKLSVRPVFGSLTIGNPLPRGTWVQVLQREGLFIKVKVLRNDNYKLPGWLPQFALCAASNRTFVKKENRKTRKGFLGSITGSDSSEYSTTAGSRAVGPMAKILEGDAYTVQDTKAVDTITDFKINNDLEEFLRQGRLGRYLFEQ